jgi:DNA polymerase-1
MFDITQLLEKYRQCKNFVSFDVETTGFRMYHGDKIFSFCFGNDQFCIVARIDKPYYAMIKTEYIIECLNSNKDIMKKVELRKSSIESNFNFLKQVLTVGYQNIGVIIHNCKFEKGFCKVHGIEFPEDLLIHDTMLMSRELDNQAPSHELDKIVHRLGGDPFNKMKICDEKIKKENKKLKGYQYINVDLMTEYQMYDAIMPLLIQYAFWPEISKNEVLLKDYIWEVQAALCTQEMEEDGIPVHFKNCDKLQSWLQKEIEQMQHDTFNLIGEYINLNADNQLRRVLFQKYSLPVITFTPSGKPSVDKDTLLKLKEDHSLPFLNLIIKYRSYTDGFANIESYKKLTDEKGFLHTSINTCQARTHRQSSSKPNLQNASKEVALKNPYPVPARKCFKCPDGCILLMPDYSGIQFRLIIADSEEKELIDLLNDDPINADPHTIAAEIFYDKLFTDQEQCIEYMLNMSPDNKKLVDKIGKDNAYKEFKSIMRSAAKNANFAKPFFANLQRIADTLRLPVDIAEPGYWRYAERWPKIFYYSQNVMRAAKEKGYVETPFGPKIYGVGDDLHMLGNYKIQHMEAKIVKRAEVRCMKWFKKEFGLKKLNILFPVHDELIIKMNRSLLPQRKEIMKTISEYMTYCPEITIPLNVGWKMTTTTWDKSEKIKV